jgi:hypothetical protein
MISKEDLKNLEFETMQEYYTYILDSKINGQFKQTRELIKDLNNIQYTEFLKFLDDNEPHNKDKFFIIARFEEV